MECRRCGTRTCGVRRRGLTLTWPGLNTERRCDDERPGIHGVSRSLIVAWTLVVTRSLIVTGRHVIG
jgi:hypothetical protein